MTNETPDFHFDAQAVRAAQERAALPTQHMDSAHLLPEGPHAPGTAPDGSIVLPAPSQTAEMPIVPPELRQDLSRHPLIGSHQLGLPAIQAAGIEKPSAISQDTPRYPVVSYDASELSRASQAVFELPGSREILDKRDKLAQIRKDQDKDRGVENGIVDTREKFFNDKNSAIGANVKTFLNQVGELRQDIAREMGTVFEEDNEVALPPPEPLPATHRNILKRLDSSIQRRLRGDIDFNRLHNDIVYAQEIDNLFAEDEIKLVTLADGLVAHPEYRAPAVVKIDPELGITGNDGSVVKLQYTDALPNEWEIGFDVKPDGISLWRGKTNGSEVYDAIYVPVDRIVETTPRTR